MHGNDDEPSLHANNIERFHRFVAVVVVIAVIAAAAAANNV